MTVEKQRGDMAIVAVDTVYQEVTYPTTGASGIVIDKSPTGEVIEEETLYMYQMQFQPEISTTVVISGIPTVYTLKLFWYDSYELGLLEHSISSVLDLDTVASNARAAYASSSTAKQITNQVLSTVKISHVEDNVKVLQGLIDTNHSLLERNASVNAKPQEEQELLAANVNNVSITLGYDQLMYQEAVENFSELSAVLYEHEEKIKARIEQERIQAEAAIRANEEDLQAYIQTFAMNPNNLDPFYPEEGTEYVPPEIKPEDLSSESITGEIILPEQETTIIFPKK